MRRRVIRICCSSFLFDTKGARAVSPSKYRSSPRAFTLIEMLVVVTIIVLLISLLLPAMKLSLGKKTTCLANLRQMGNALTLYAVEHDRRLPFDNWRGVETGNPTSVPAGFLYDFKVRDPEAFGGKPQEEVIGHVRTGTRWDFIQGTELYRCPEDPRPTWTGSEAIHQMTSYPMNGAIGAYGRKAGKAFSIRAFDHDTVVLFEVDYSFWWDGSDFPSQGLATRHEEGGNMVNIDGSAEWMDLYDWDTEESFIPCRLWSVPNSGK